VTALTACVERREASGHRHETSPPEVERMLREDRDEGV
jgi:hypothetical protein